MLLRNLVTTLLIFSFLSIPGIARQTTYQLQADPVIRVDGDSNVRTWGADAETVSGSLTLHNGTLLSLETLTPENFGNLEITVETESLDSGTRGLTRNMHNYLKSGEHPRITFTLNEVTDITMNNGQALIVANGVIQAAGADNPVTMTVLAEVLSENSIRFTGEHEMLMSDFGIDPPTAVFGTVRSDDEIVVRYDVTFAN